MIRFGKNVRSAFLVLPLLLTLLCHTANAENASSENIETVSHESSSMAEIPAGFIIIEGDIIVPENFFTSRATFAANPWTGGIVPYEFDANVSALNQSRTIAAMDEWEARANITFIPRAGHANFVHIQSGTGNNSNLGMIGGQQTINMISWSSKYVIVHELGHTLSYWHEQSRTDRDSYIQINLGNIQPGFEGQFGIRSNGGEVGPYDFDSTMHYGQCFFSTCCPAGSTCACPSNCTTITVLPPNESFQNLLGQRDHLSEWDSRGMAAVYGFSGPDCNANYIKDSFDISSEASQDCNSNGIPDDCETDCNNNNIPDDCDITNMTSSDCNTNTIPDECDVNLTSIDCNLNVIPDECELSGNDCNGNSIPDDCDIVSLRSANCNNNSIPDECENDCNCNGIDDATDVAGVDCNSNISPDDCDIALGLSGDCDLNGVPDECESPSCIMSLDFALINSSGIRSATPGRVAASYTLISSSGHPIAGGDSTSASYEESAGFLAVATSNAANAPLALLGEPGFSKDRYVSIDATTNGNELVATRITRVGGVDKYLDCTSLTDLGPDGWYAVLIDGPLPAAGDAAYYCDFSGVTSGMHVRGCSIVPGNTYDVAMTTDGSTFSTALSISTTSPQFGAGRQFGDLVGSFVAGAWTAPEGLVTSGDIVAVVKKFQSELGAPIIARVNNSGEVPNTIVSAAGDVLRAVQAFAAAPFGFGVTGCLVGTCVPNCP